MVNVPNRRKEKISAVRKRLNTGTYCVSSALIADSIAIAGQKLILEQQLGSWDTVSLSGSDPVSQEGRSRWEDIVFC